MNNDRSLRPFSRISRYPLDLSSNRFHFAILQNLAKYEAFARAFGPIVPGATVLDLGTGSGILSLIAASLGASHVVAVDRPSTIELAKAVLDSHPSFRRRITLVSADVFDLPQASSPFDVVVSETIGYLGYEENIAAILARGSELAGQDASIIPQELVVHLHPVRIPRTPKSDVPFLSRAGAVLASGTTLQAPTTFAFGAIPRDPLLTHHRWQSTTMQRLDGLVATFSVHLGADAWLSNAESSIWPRCVIPFTSSHWVGSGAILDLSLLLSPKGDTFYANVEVKAAASELERLEILTSDISAEHVDTEEATDQDVIRAVSRVLSVVSAQGAHRERHRAQCHA